MRIAWLVAVSTVCALAALAQEPVPDPAASLRDRYAALGEQLEQSPIQQGLYLESAESSRTLRGDIYAVVGYPFSTISDTLTSPDAWCEALILHINVKYCQAAVGGERTVLSVAIGKKIDQPLSEAYEVDFTYNVTASRPDYMAVDLTAKKGPLGTKNYLIALELIDLNGERAFLHIRYSYTQGFMARLATSIYLGSSGQDKVGFTMVAGKDNQPPHLVRGVRGALERNTMRYYLAIDAYLGTQAIPAPLRFEASLERWFATTERYPLQLHEVDYETYVTMKRSEHLRQQTLP